MFKIVPYKYENAKKNENKNKMEKQWAIVGSQW